MIKSTSSIAYNYSKLSLVQKKKKRKKGGKQKCGKHREETGGRKAMRGIRAGWLYNLQSLVSYILRIHTHVDDSSVPRRVMRVEAT